MGITPARTPAEPAGAAVSDTERPPPVEAEPTRIGRPPDPAAARPPAGPATPRGLRAAPPSRPGVDPASAPKLAAAAPPAAPPQVPGPPALAAAVQPQTVPLPFDPLPTPPAPKVAVQAPNAHGTSLGLAPAVTKARGITPGGAELPRTRRCTSCDELYPADFLVCPRDATPLTTLEGTDADPLVGALVGDTYQIVRVVGEGGMGRVYEARHLRLKERRFAVKCLHSDLAKNAEMAARFLREAESASSIKHENVVDVFDVHHLPDGTPYLVGEFLEGEELADYVAKRGPLEPRAAAKIGRQVCRALAAAHERGIIHRDMKPENVFVLTGPNGAEAPTRVKVLDFGISKAGPSDNSHLTKTGVIMGTPSYMAPEQARGRPVDRRADVYSVGACLYFMVTGRRPFDSDDPTTTLTKVLTEDPVRPREIDPRIPEAIELVIQRAMAKDVGDRYPSMAELEKALAGLANQATVIPSLTSESLIPVPVQAPDIQVAGGAARALDVAKAFLGSGSLPPPAQHGGDLARTARPTIVIASIALGGWLVGGTVAALAGLVRVLHDGEVTLTEALLLVAGCLFAAATPLVLYVMHLRKMWPNSMRAVQLAVDLRRATVSALVAYGGLAIIGRVSHTVLFRSSHGLASGVWDILLFLFSLLAGLTIGGFAPLLRNLRRRRRD